MLHDTLCNGAKAVDFDTTFRVRDPGFETTSRDRAGTKHTVD